MSFAIPPMPAPPACRALYERRAEENDFEWNAFAEYRDLGQKRTFRALARIVGKSVGNLHGLSRRRDWASRCAAWDADQTPVEGAQVDPSSLAGMIERTKSLIEGELRRLEADQRAGAGEQILKQQSGLTRSLKILAELLEQQAELNPPPHPGSEDTRDYENNLTHEELLLLKALLQKADGDPHWAQHLELPVLRAVSHLHVRPKELASALPSV